MLKKIKKGLVILCREMPSLETILICAAIVLTIGFFIYAPEVFLQKHEGEFTVIEKEVYATRNNVTYLICLEDENGERYTVDVDSEEYMQQCDQGATINCRFYSFTNRERCDYFKIISAT